MGEAMWWGLALVVGVAQYACPSLRLLAWIGGAQRPILSSVLHFAQDKDICSKQCTKGRSERVHRRQQQIAGKLPLSAESCGSIKMQKRFLTVLLLLATPV